MTIKRRILTIFAACAFAVAGLGTVPASAAPGHIVSTTVTQHGTFTVNGAADFCTGELITPTITGNQVTHVTYFPGGDEAWGTFTVEGQGSFVQASTGLTFSGRVTVWGNFNVNEKNSNNTFTATFRLTAVDSYGVTHTESGHITSHITFNALDPANPVVSFTDFNATCS